MQTAGCGVSWRFFFNLILFRQKSGPAGNFKLSLQIHTLTLGYELSKQRCGGVAASLQRPWYSFSTRFREAPFQRHLKWLAVN